MKTVDFSKVTIRGENTNVYIAMNAQGNLYTTVSDNCTVSDQDSSTVYADEG